MRQADDFSSIEYPATSDEGIARVYHTTMWKIGRDPKAAFHDVSFELIKIFYKEIIKNKYLLKNRFNIHSVSEVVVLICLDLFFLYVQYN
jgi:hypothetical protein